MRWRMRGRLDSVFGEEWVERIHYAAAALFIAGSILWPLGFTMTGFTALFAAIVLMRMRTTLARTKAEARMRRMARA